MNILFKVDHYISKITRSIYSNVPNMTVNNQKIINGVKWVGEHISSPQNRLILGASALMSQPFIDLYNKNVDEETRKTSAARTVAKIIAGTTTGFLVRYYCIKAIDTFAKIPKKGVKPWETILTPDMVKTGLKNLGNYKQALGTILSLWVMLFTNFAIDAPFTKYLTNKFINKVHNYEQYKKWREQVNNE
ncbi:hypothetical protein J6G99_02195 [bacterium]|nr:hypothetical protein [bacterium]